ncbi:hypothetical protein ABVT39_014641 [Epinephelus coioides]
MSHTAKEPGQEMTKDKDMATKQNGSMVALNKKTQKAESPTEAERVTEKEERAKLMEAAAGCLGDPVKIRRERYMDHTAKKQGTATDNGNGIMDKQTTTTKAAEAGKTAVKQPEQMIMAAERRVVKEVEENGGGWSDEKMAAAASDGQCITCKKASCVCDERVTADLTEMEEAEEPDQQGGGEAVERQESAGQDSLVMMGDTEEDAFCCTGVTFVDYTAKNLGTDKTKETEMTDKQIVGVVVNGKTQKTAKPTGVGKVVEVDKERRVEVATVVERKQWKGEVEE